MLPQRLLTHLISHRRSQVLRHGTTAIAKGERGESCIGAFQGSGSTYDGQITDLAEDKTYRGKASVNGNAMDLKGCVLGGLICRGETWQRQ